MLYDHEYRYDRSKSIFTCDIRQRNNVLKLLFLIKMETKTEFIVYLRNEKIINFFYEMKNI
jgi:hypothetical protein